MTELIIAIVTFCSTEPKAKDCQKRVLACTWYHGVHVSGYTPDKLPACVAKELERK